MERERVDGTEAAVTPAPDADAPLVAFALAGDRRAFEFLVVKYQRTVASIVARRVRDADAVEDVTQEVFLRAYRGLPGFKGESPFAHWIARIAANTALKYLDSKRRSKVVLAQDLVDEDVDGELAFEARDPGSPERVAMANQIAATLERALDRLDPSLREAITLYEVDGLSYREIADRVGIPLGTVRSRIFRAREELAQKLRPVLDPLRDRRW
jgi:RNA polymerase sigma-70 factor (ECF subfamily)